MSSDEESEMDEFPDKLAAEEASPPKKVESVSGDSKNGSFGNFKCEKCLRKFARKYSLNRHQKNVPNCGATREYACRFCPEICANRDNLRDHEMKHKRPSAADASQVPTDESKFSEEEESEDSEDSEEEWPLKCLLCEKSFKSASDLRLHTVKAHNDDGVVADAFPSNRAKEAVLLRDTKDLEPKKATEKHKPAESSTSKKPGPLDPTKKSKEKDSSVSNSSHARPANREKSKISNRDSVSTSNSANHLKRPKDSDIKPSSRESLGGTHSANVSRKAKEDNGKLANTHSPNLIKKYKAADGKTPIRDSKPSSGSSQIKKSKEGASSTLNRSSKTSSSSHQLKRHKEGEGKTPNRDSTAPNSSHSSKKHKADLAKDPNRSSKPSSSSNPTKKSRPNDHRPSNRDSKTVNTSSHPKKSKESKSKTDKPAAAEKARTTNVTQPDSVSVNHPSQIVHSSGAIPPQQGMDPASGMNVYPPKNENVVIIQSVNPVNYSVPPHLISGMSQTNMVPVSSVAPTILTSQVPYNHTQQTIQSGVNNTTVLPSLFNQVGVPSFQNTASNSGQIVSHVEPNQQIILNDLMHSAPVNVQNPAPNYYHTNDFNENVSLPAHIFSSEHLNLNQDHNHMNANAFTNVNSPNVYLNHSLPPPAYVNPVHSNYAKPNPSHDVQMNAPPTYTTVNTNESYPVACNISMNEHVNLTQVGTYKRDEIPGQTEVATSLNFATLDNNQPPSASGMLQGLNCEGSALAGLDLGESSSSHLTGGTFPQAVTVLSGPSMGVPNQQQTNQFYHNNYYNPVQNVPISTSGYMNTTPVYVNDNSGFSHQSYTNTNFFPNQNNTGQLNLDELVAMTPTNINDQFNNQSLDYPPEPLVYTDLSNSGGPVPSNNDSSDMPPEESIAMAENAGNPDNKPIPCLVCEKSFFTKSGLRYHTKRFHPDHVAALASLPPLSAYKAPKVESIEKPKEKGPLQCLFCEKTFFTKCGMKAHTVKHHAQEFTPKTMNQLTSKAKKPTNNQEPETVDAFSPPNANTSTPNQLPQNVTNTVQVKAETNAGNAEAPPVDEIKRCKIDGVTFIYCLFCEKPFSTRSGLRWHTAKHHGADALEKTNNALVNVRISHVPDGHVRKYKKSGEKAEKVEKVEKVVKKSPKYSKEPGGFYKCSSCEKCYSTNQGLKEHFERHHSGKPFVRANASKSSKLAAALTKTLGEENNDASTSKDTSKAIQCMFCVKPFFTKSGLRYHIKRNHREHYHEDGSVTVKTEDGTEVKEEVIAECEEVSLNQSSHNSIPKNSVDDITMPCDICHQIFNNEDIFDVHMKAHSDEKADIVIDKSVKCPYCDKIFPAKRSLVNHTIQKHRDMLLPSRGGQIDVNAFHGESGTAPPTDKLPDGTIKTECDNEISADQISFNENATNESTFKKEFILDERKSPGVSENYNTFTLDDTLEQQQIEQLLQEHDDSQRQRKSKKPLPTDVYGHPMFFRCKYCNLQFETQYSLRKHMKKHTRDAVVFCKFCGKDFPGKISLLRHTVQNHKDMSEPLVPTATPNIENKQYTPKEDKAPVARLETFANKNTASSSAAEIPKEIKSEPTESPDNSEKQQRLKSFSCKICNTVLENRKAWHMHVTKHFDEVPSKSHDSSKQQRKKTLTCKICFTVLENRREWHQHMRTHFRDVPQKCHVCHRMFPKRLSLMRHIFQTHKNISRQSLNFKFMGEPEEIIKTENEGNLQKKEFPKVPERSRLILKNRSAGSEKIQSNIIIKSEICFTKDTANLRNSKHGPGSCKLCNRHFETTKALHKHMMEHVRNPKGCKFCDRVFPNGRSLTRHAIQTHRSEVLAIRRKAKIADDKKYPLNWLRAQIEKEVKKESVAVPLEDIDIKSETHDLSSCDVSVYSSTTSDSDESYQSESIKRADSSAENILKKEKKKKRSSSEYTCKICPRAFNMKSRLIQHLVEHVKVPEVCPYCSKRYPAKNFLARHKMKKHRNIKCGPFKSKDIPFRNADAPIKIRKQRKCLDRSEPVDGETLCRICKKVFDTTAELRVHWKKHKKRRPASCEVCGLILSSRTSLRRHMFLIHKTNLPKLQIHNRKTVTKEVKSNIPKIPLVRILEKKEYIRDNIWSNDDPKKANFHQDFTNINIDELPLFDHKANDEFIRKMEEKMGLRDFFLDRIPLKEQNKIETNNKTNDEIKPDPDEVKIGIDDKENIKEDIPTPELFEGHKELKINFNKIFGGANKDEVISPEDLDQFEHEFYEYYTDVEANLQDDLFSEFLISDEKLKSNMDRFLKTLLGENTMRSFGWPEKSSDEVLSQIISKCGHVPATHDDDPCDNTTHIRENMTLFFKFVVDNNVAKKLLYSHTVDQILMRILETAKEDEVKVEKAE